MATMKHTDYDLVVIGGGINGTGIAADAAGRGLKVLLCEKDDLASGTSSKSSKLIHGGLRYLEHNEFRLVRESLIEREVLLKKAPHIIWPLRFQLPHQPHLRPLWMLRLGLLLYDNLGSRTNLASSRSIRFDDNSPLMPSLIKGFEYSDLWVDDARLVVLNALQAESMGAKIKTRTECRRAKRIEKHWQVTLGQQNNQSLVSTKALVNAAGPWVEQVSSTAIQQSASAKLRLVRGSHIVVPKMYNGSQAFILQNIDKRIVFVIPYEDHFSLIGTTDIDHTNSPDNVIMSKKEQSYLIDVVNSYFKQSIATKDIVYSYSGVRALVDQEGGQAQTLTRDYVLSVDTASGRAPLLSVYGGKITTFRKLAESAVNKLMPYFGIQLSCQTEGQCLPGGDFLNRDQLLEDLQMQFPFLPFPVLQRYVRTYGTKSYVLLNRIRSFQAMGEDFSHGLYAREVDYLVEKEWARTDEDILWRRTKLGLVIGDEKTTRLKEYLKSKTGYG